VLDFPTKMRLQEVMLGVESGRVVAHRPAAAQAIRDMARDVRLVFGG
jgi:hypothetical protein